MPPKTADMSAEDKIRTFIGAYGDAMPPQNIDSGFVRHATLKSVTEESDTSNAKIVWSLVIPPLCGNSPFAKTIHGGAIATFFDNATSMAVYACKAHWGHSGVTRNLNVTYFRPPLEGELITVECEVLQLASRLATIKGVMRRESDGTVLAICQHDKYRPSAPKPKL
jgi:acyl-coenzyme A thioesterase 13